MDAEKRSREMDPIYPVGDLPTDTEEALAEAV